jgi:hypothetical protein
VPAVVVPPSSGPTTTSTPTLPIEATFTSLPRILYRPTMGTGSCGASGDLVVSAGQHVTGVDVRWTDASGRSGSVALARSGTEWRGRLEVPAGGQGPATLRAVARDATGATGASTDVVRRVANCPTPG